MFMMLSAIHHWYRRSHNRQWSREIIRTFDEQLQILVNSPGSEVGHLTYCSNLDKYTMC